MDKCTACGECAKVCPIEVTNRFDEGLRARKAAYKLYPRPCPAPTPSRKAGTAPCKATCPANVSVQGWIALMNQGKYPMPSLFKKEHPFPGVCGRVCHHPCESACTRAKLDQPLGIQHLHRYLADWDMERQNAFVPEKKAQQKPEGGRRRLRAGGLTCAYFLAIEGYEVTVFEKHPVLGGMLTCWAFPNTACRATSSRPKSRPSAPGRGIQNRCGNRQNRHHRRIAQAGLQGLFHGHRLPGVQGLGIEGEDLRGVPGMDYLRRINLGEKVVLGDRVAVIGGGNVAMDAVRTALRHRGRPNRSSFIAAARLRCRPVPRRSPSAARKASRS
jgi:hypothetical protein